MDQIVEDIRAKAPIIEQQRIDFEKSEGVIQQLTCQLDDQQDELSDLRMKLFQANGSRDRLAEQNDALAGEVKSLNAKIAVLITESDREVMDDVEYKKRLSTVVQLQNDLSEKSKQLNMLEQRLEVAEGE